MTRPIISIIAAMDQNRVIGNNNALIWDIPEDMKWFRNTTRGKPVIMGRKTFESIGRLLPKRLNIIISRQEGYSLPEFPEAKTANSLEDALKIATDSAQENSLEEVCIIGGAQIYALGLPLADRLYLTHIDHAYEGDTFFPKFDENEWDIKTIGHHEAVDEIPAFTFKTYDKKLSA